MTAVTALCSPPARGEGAWVEIFQYRTDEAGFTGLFKLSRIRKGFFKAVNHLPEIIYDTIV